MIMTSEVKKTLKGKELTQANEEMERKTLEVNLKDRTPNTRIRQRTSVAYTDECIAKSKMDRKWTRRQNEIQQLDHYKHRTTVNKGIKISWKA